MYLPPDLVPKGNLMTPRIPGMDIFVLLLHVWYTQSSCLSASLQFRIFLGLFLLKKRKFDVFTPGLGPKRKLMTPRIPGIDIFVFLIHAWYRQSSCLSVFLQFRIFLGLFLLKTRKFDVLTPGFGPKEGLSDH